MLELVGSIVGTDTDTVFRRDKFINTYRKHLCCSGCQPVVEEPLSENSENREAHWGVWWRNRQAWKKGKRLLSQAVKGHNSFNASKAAKVHLLC